MTDTTARDREIVCLYLAKELNQSEIARHYGITRERVRQIICNAGAESALARKRARAAARNIARAVAVVARHEIGQTAHGTRYHYMYYQCRCEPCRAANREYQRGLKGRTPSTHGVSGYANYGCRCDVCREANNKKNREQSDRRMVWAKVGEAVRSGALVKPDACEDCDGPGPLHGHHEDYDKPLEVAWICPPCHARRHTPIRQGRRAKVAA